ASCARAKYSLIRWSGRGQANESTLGRAANPAASASSPAKASKKFRPKGRSVASRISETLAPMRPAGMCVAPSTPSPPAWHTAAASWGDVPTPIPPRAMGCRRWTASVNRVASTATSTPHPIADRAATSRENARDPARYARLVLDVALAELVAQAPLIFLDALVEPPRGARRDHGPEPRAREERQANEKDDVPEVHRIAYDRVRT